MLIVVNFDSIYCNTPLYRGSITGPLCCVNLLCCLRVGSAPYKPRVNVWHTHWPSLELTVHKQEGTHTIGIHYKQVAIHPLVLFSLVKLYSLARLAHRHIRVHLVPGSKMYITLIDILTG